MQVGNGGRREGGVIVLFNPHQMNTGPGGWNDPDFIMTGGQVMSINGLY